MRRPARTTVACAAALAAALACSAPAAGAARTRIDGMSMRQIGKGPPGPGYYVEVVTRVRVCGARGRMVARFSEKLSPPGQSSPVWARHRRVGRRAHRHRCQTHRFAWRLGQRFFGVGRYRVGVRVKTTGRGWSRVAARHHDTID